MGMRAFISSTHEPRTSLLEDSTLVGQSPDNNNVVLRTKRERKTLAKPVRESCVLVGEGYDVPVLDWTFQAN
jgi:hypothetical protein